MNRHISLGVLVVGLSIVACGSSSSSTSSTSRAITSAAGASSGGSAAGATGSGAGGSANNTTGVAATGTGTGGGLANGSTGGSSTGVPQDSVSNFAGSGVIGGNCGPWGADAVFSPNLLGVDGTGNIYITGDALDMLAGDGGITVLLSPLNPTSGDITSAVTVGLAVTPAAAIYYAQTANFSNTTSIIQLMGKTGTTIYTPQNMMNPSCVDTGSMSGLGEPAGIAADSQGNIYVADESCFDVRKITPAGVLSTIAGTPTVQGEVNGPGSMAEFGQMAAITIDPNGIIYVAESDTGFIRQVQPDGTTSTYSANAHNVGGLAADANGNVYFSDTEDNTIQMVDSSGHVSTIAGNGQMGAVNGPAASAEFNSPVGIGVDANGNVYVADSANCLVRKITPPGN